MRKSSSADLISFNRVSVLAYAFSGLIFFTGSLSLPVRACLPVFQCAHWCAELGVVGEGARVTRRGGGEGRAVERGKARGHVSWS